MAPIPNAPRLPTSTLPPFRLSSLPGFGALVYIFGDHISPLPALPPLPGFTSLTTWASQSRSLAATDMEALQCLLRRRRPLLALELLAAQHLCDGSARRTWQRGSKSFAKCKTQDANTLPPCHPPTDTVVFGSPPQCRVAARTKAPCTQGVAAKAPFHGATIRRPSVQNSQLHGTSDEGG